MFSENFLQNIIYIFSAEIKSPDSQQNVGLKTRPNTYKCSSDFFFLANFCRTQAYNTPNTYRFSAEFFYRNHAESFLQMQASKVGHISTYFLQNFAYRISAEIILKILRKCKIRKWANTYIFSTEFFYTVFLQKSSLKMRNPRNCRLNIRCHRIFYSEIFLQHTQAKTVRQIPFKFCRTGEGNFTIVNTC